MRHVTLVDGIIDASRLGLQAGWTKARKRQPWIALRETLLGVLGRAHEQTPYARCPALGKEPSPLIDTIAICAGTLDLPSGLHTELAIFTDDAADYHTLDPAVPTRGGE